MTKWKRLRRLRERKRAEAEALKPKAEVMAELTEPEIKLTEHANLGDPRKIKKPEPKPASKPNTILAQIPRYLYLAAFFALLSGIFFPLIQTLNEISYLRGEAFLTLTIQGTAILFLGLVGGILVYKGATSGKTRRIFIAIGFALIATSLALIFMLQEFTKQMYLLR